MKQKRYLSALLLALVLMAMCPANLRAQSTFSGSGSGTKEDPYLIATAAQLGEFRDIVNGLNGFTQNAAACAKLTANIENLGAWTPIGTESTPYTGTFNGDGKSITGMTIAYTTSYQGLFGNVSSATLKNFIVGGVMTSITSDVSEIGGVAGKTLSSTIENVVSNVNITIGDENNKDVTQSHIAGVVGNCDNTTVSVCTNNGAINACASTDCIGGVVGYARDGAKLTSCLNTGAISTTGTDAHIAGIIAYCNHGSFKGISNCLNTGTIDGSSSTAGAVFGYYGSKIESATNNYNYYKVGTANQAIGGGNTTAALNANPVTEEQLANGYTCWRLNGKKSSGTLYWYQNIGTDAIPVFDTTHKTVYPVGESYMNSPYTVTTSNIGYTNQEASKAFDSSTDTKWCGNNGTDTNIYVEFTTNNAMKVGSYTFTTADDATDYPVRNPKTWTLKGKVNSTDAWTSIDTRTNSTKMPAKNKTAVTFYLPEATATAYKYFRIDFTHAQSTTFQLSEITLSSTVCPHTNLTHHDAVINCTTNGNIEYWTCNDCGQYFNNSNHSDESKTNAEGIVTSPAGHDYDAHTHLCTRCQDPEVGQIANGEGTEASPYQIATVADLIWLSRYVNAGKSNYNTAWYVLTADINLSSVCHAKDEANSVAEANWTPIGNDTNPFQGKFNGQGHCITNMYIHYTTGYKGLFGKTNGATVKNFSISGTMTSGTSNVEGSVQCIGGAIGWAYNSTVEDITSSVNITLNAGTEQKLMGGVVGDCDGTTISGCLYNGTLDAGNSGDCVGGITGYFRADAKTTKGYQIINCCNAGSVTTTSTGCSVGGILGYTNDGNFMGAHNCLNLGKITTGNSTTGAIYGRYRKAGASAGSNNYYKSGSATQGFAQNESGTTISSVFTEVNENKLASGEVCYLLNGKKSTGTLAWYQKLPSASGDATPVLKSTGSNTVYYGYSGCIQIYANTALSNTPGEHNYVDGFCSLCGADQNEPVKVTAANAESLGLTANYVGYYAIKTAGNLKWFSDKVKNQNSTYKKANAVLTADIDLSSVCHAADAENSIEEANWTPIGYDSNNAYYGIFDGNNHNITGLYTNYTTNNQGLFGYVKGATIKNFSLSGEMRSSTKDLCHIGGVVGNTSYGSTSSDLTTIEGVICHVNITIDAGKQHQNVAGIAGVADYTTVSKCTYTGAIDAGATHYYAAGIAARAGNYTTIQYCHNRGSVKSTGNYTDAYFGGIVALQYSKYFKGIKYCLNEGSVTGGTKAKVGAICGYYQYQTTNAENVGNYYLKGSVAQAIGSYTTTMDLSGMATYVTAKQISSGAACYLLNNCTSTGELAWYQKLGAEGDATPVLKSTGNNTVYAGYDNSCVLSYTNDAQNTYSTTKTHSHDVDGICHVCNDYQNIVTAENCSTYGLSADYIGYYVISNPAQLAWFATVVNSNDDDSKVVNVVLTQDLDLSTVCSSALGNWTPIGTTTAPYCGIFDGRNHSITGMYINYSTSYQGLFGCIKLATLKNFSVSGTMTSSTADISAIAGVVGGVIRNASANSTIQGVTNNVNITVAAGISQNYLAGIVGEAKGTAISRCVNNGNIDAGASGSGKVVGGIAGYAYYGKISNCLNTGSISCTGGAYVGGILGEVLYSGFYGVEYCLNVGQFSCGTYSRGIIGYVGSGVDKSYMPLYHTNYYQSGKGATDAYRHEYGYLNNNNTAVTAEQLTRGEICNKLNDSNSTGDLVWYQTIGTDSYPVMDNTHGIVYAGYADSSSPLSYANTPFAAPAKAMKFVIASNNVGTFYYDDNSHAGDGEVYSINNVSGWPLWYLNIENSPVTQVVFDASFADARPVICTGWFYKFANLTTITGLSNLNTSEVTHMNLMFMSCKSLTSLDLSSFNTAKVTDMHEMFYAASNLANITLGDNFVTDNVESMYNMFRGTKVTSLDLSKFNTSKVTRMYDMIYDCPNLTELTIGNFDMQLATRPSYTTTYCAVIGSCPKLKTLTLKAVPYLQDGTFNTQFTGDGVTVNYQLDDNSVIFTGTNYLPAATTAPTYTRTVAAASNWGTMVLPYESKSDANVKLYTISAVSNDQLTLSSVETVAANTPCLFKKQVENAASVTINANSVSAPAAATPVTPAAVNGITLTGKYALTEITAENGYIISNNSFWSIQAIKGSNKVYCAPFRAYLASESSASRSHMFIGDYTGTTAVQALDAIVSGTARYFDLNGREIYDLQPGMNIVKYSNGKTAKVFVNDSNEPVQIVDAMSHQTRSQVEPEFTSELESIYGE